MSGPLKTTYAGYLRIPTSASAPLVDQNETTIGGDIVKNFRAIGNILQSNGAGGIILDTSHTNLIDSMYGSAIIDSENSTVDGDHTVLLGSNTALAHVPYSINNIDNRCADVIIGITGSTGISCRYAHSSWYFNFLRIDIAESAILDIDAIYVDSSDARNYISYHLVVDSAQMPEVAVTVTHGTDSKASPDSPDPRFYLDNSYLWIKSYGDYIGVVLNIRYTILQNETLLQSYYGSI